jgi:hypothetical protein
MGATKKKGKVRQALLISTENQEEMFFLESLLKKLGIKSKLLTDEEREDFGLGLLMKEADTGKTVSYEKVMKKLKGK